MDIRELYDKVSEGSKFYVNFKERTVRVDKKVYNISDIEYKKNDSSEEETMDVLLSIYEGYKHSVPSERSDNHHKSYFKALPYEKLSDDDILYGTPREFARCVLGMTFLINVSEGKIKWHDEWGSWFYQSPMDKDFVILKDWVQPKKD